jgi:hypothetical protein
MMVMMMASTPSLNASSLVGFMTDPAVPGEFPSDEDRGRRRDQEDQ